MIIYILFAIISFFIGILVAKIYQKQHHTIKYPTIKNVGKIKYLDDDGKCYVYGIEYIK